MRNLLSILRYELKMQLAHAGPWAILVFVVAVALLDTFPSTANMNRLAYLTDQGYVVLRLLAQEGVLLLFGMMFILSDRIRGDKKRGTMELFMATPLSKAQYIWGKLLGNYAATLLVMAIHLAANALVQLAFNPGPFTPAPYIVGFFAMAIPACFFVAAGAVAFPVLADIRWFYVAFSVYFLMNADFIYTENAVLRSLYIFQKETLKLVYTFEGFESLMATKLLWNLAFLICAGAGSMLLLQVSGRFWRETAESGSCR